MASKRNSPTRRASRTSGGSGWRQSQRKPSASCVRSGAVSSLALFLEGRAHREQRHDREDVGHRVGEERQRAAEAEERAAERRARRASPSRSAPARLRRRPAAARAGTTERSAPTSATLKNTNSVPSTNATIAICANETRCDRERDDELATGADAHDVGHDHHPLAVEAVGGDAGGEAEEGPRHETREADDAGLRRRVRDREHEQRIRDRRRLGADRRERLPDLEQDEVAVAAERQLMLIRGRELARLGESRDGTHASEPCRKVRAPGECRRARRTSPAQRSSRRRSPRTTGRADGAPGDDETRALDAAEQAIGDERVAVRADDRR